MTYNDLNSKVFFFSNTETRTEREGLSFFQCEKGKIHQEQD